MKKFMLFTFPVIFAFALQAQSPVGKWKFTAVYTESFAGEKTDMLKDFTKSDPCFTKVIYHFTTDGKIGVLANGCTKEVPGDKFALWKTAGKTIKLYAGKDDTEPETFDLEIVGNKMRWIKRYNYESDIDRATGIKLIVEEFTKQ